MKLSFEHLSLFPFPPERFLSIGSMAILLLLPTLALCESPGRSGLRFTQGEVNVSDVAFDGCSSVQWNGGPICVEYY
jgi:hypothetical protein